MIRVTRRYEFSASHRLNVPGLSERGNQRLYGKCNNPFGHGHNYVLEVSGLGPLDHRSGRAVDLTALDSLMRDWVSQTIDRKYLNEVIRHSSNVGSTIAN